MKHSNGQPTIFFKLGSLRTLAVPYYNAIVRWPDVYSMKVKDKNFGIETATETVMFRMVGTYMVYYML